MAKSTNPFSKENEPGKGAERAIKICLLLATYTIIACAFGIFGKIIIEGAPVLYKKGWAFLSEKPQTLTVLETEKSDNILVPTKNFENILNSNHDKQDLFTNIKYTEKAFPFVRFTLEKESLIGEGYLKNIETQNDGFYLLYDERSTKAPVAFNLDSDKKITLKLPDFEALQTADPNIIPADFAQREVNINRYQVTINAGEYPINKNAHDALVPTDLIFQMKQTFADDDAAKINTCVIPETQTITIDGTIFFTAFNEDEVGSLPVAEQKEIPNPITFVDFTIPKGNHKTNNAALAVLEKNGINTLHNSKKGAIIVNETTKDLILPTAEFTALTSENPALKISNQTNFDQKQPYVSFSLAKDAELWVDNSDREALASANETTGNFKTTSEKSHSYSGGGILGPMVGTALLVIICMTIALFTGIAASVFLTEYAKAGTLVRSIRLAMLNLAGVPSIVFGLFGLGLFVILAPAVTFTPKADAEYILPVLPFASQPGLREIEDRKILVNTEDKLGIDELSIRAAADGYTRVYTGNTYLSFQGWGNCMLAGGFTLAIMVLPVIITACEESLRAVPMGFREASLALGASKWQSIRTAVLPYAFPGILTASVLGITRVAGETAPIMFTAAVAEKSDLPWEGLHATGFDAFLNFLQQSVQALPYHIYTVAGKIPQSEYTEPMQFGSVLVFMLIVMSFAGFSVFLRIRVRSKLKW